MPKPKESSDMVTPFFPSCGAKKSEEMDYLSCTESN